MSHYAQPPPAPPDWPGLKSSPLPPPDTGAATPPAFQPPNPSVPNPPSSSPAWQGIRLPTTPSSTYHPLPPQHTHPHAYAPYPPHKQLPHRPTPLNLASGMGDEELRRQRHILSPQPRYPSPSGFPQQSRLELDLLRQQTITGPPSSVPGFWSPQPGRGSFTSPPPPPGHQFQQPPVSTHFHSPPPAPSSQGVTLPPKFLAKQSPSITPLQAGLHPNHQASQLSAGLLSIQTTLGQTGELKQEVTEASPHSTTASVQDPHTSSSDEPQRNGMSESNAGREVEKEDGCHSTAASPPHVSTTRISPGNQDNSSTSATDTPNSILDEDKPESTENQQQEAENLTETSDGRDLSNDTQELSSPMETGELNQNGNSEPQGTPSSHNLTQEEGEVTKKEPCDSAQEVLSAAARKDSGQELPRSSADTPNQLVMDVDGPGDNGNGLEPVTPSSQAPSTPNPAESAAALLSLSQAGGVLGMPQPSDDNLSAALRLEEKIHEEAIRRANILQATGIVVSSSAQIQPPLPPIMPFANQATVTRPPGLGPAVSSAPLPPNFPSPFGRTNGGGISGFPGQGLAPGTAAPYQCPICGFSSTSKFHFNSHMNTHTDHQCTMCDYTARTEGRLKRHMEGHSDEEKMRARVNHVGEPLKPAVGPRTSESSSGGSPDGPDGDESGHGTEPSPLERLQMQLNDAAPTSITASIAATPPSDSGTPRRSNTSSKPKNYKCKQCEHVSRSKEESWQHARVHIKPDKLLTCPQCEFVTEYKHHLEYHLRNHFGSKPFQCQKCHYSCVNKSMLNSHMKSHSQFYQFRCSDCTYATKYCHSLKLHLRKYGHRPATVITPDGQHIDPSQNLDLYGTRARNRQRQRESSSPHFSSPNSSMHGDHTAQGSPANTTLGSLGSPNIPAPTMVTGFDASLFQQQHQQASAMANSIATLGARLPTIPTIASLQMQMKQALLQRQQELAAQAASGLKCPHCDFRTEAKEELDKHVISHFPAGAGPGLASLYEAIQARAALVGGGMLQAPPSDEAVSVAGQSPGPGVDSPPDGAASSGSPVSKGSGDEASSATTNGSTAGSDKPAGSSRRKGKARKVDSIARRLQECRSVDNMAPTTMGLEGVPKAPSAPVSGIRMEDDSPPPDKDPELNFDAAFVCRHCRMAFKHEMMYQFHMGFHSYDSPYRCNRCGYDAPDELGFFMHIAQAKHL